MKYCICYGKSAKAITVKVKDGKCYCPKCGLEIKMKENQTKHKEE